MNLRNITLAFLGLIGLFSACNSDTEYDLSLASKNAQISSFSLTGVHDKTLDSLGRATDSVRFVVLGKTKFAIDQVNDLIYNPDSLPYGFTLKNLLPAITYIGSPYSVTIELKNAIKEGLSDTTFQWNSSDSINFAYKNISLEVVPATQSGADSKVYKLDIRIHKVDPDVIDWKLAGNMPQGINERKATLSGGSIHVLARKATSGFEMGILNGAEYPSLGTVVQKEITGLPTNTKVSSFNHFNGVLYVLSDDGKTFKSDEGEVWTEVNNGKNVAEILGIAPGNTDADNKIIVLLNNGSNTHFGATSDFSTIDQLTVIPSDFPVKGFASVSNLDDIKSRRLLFVGTGKDQFGEDLNSVWMLKMNAGNLSVAQGGTTSLFEGAGNSLFMYDGKLYMYSKNKFYTSSTWGIAWEEGIEKQELPSSVQNYVEQSVIVRNNAIWILGGKDSAGGYPTTVWTGKLNRLK